MPIVDWRTSKAALVALARPVNSVPDEADASDEQRSGEPEPKTEQDDT